MNGLIKRSPYWINLKHPFFSWIGVELSEYGTGVVNKC